MRFLILGYSAIAQKRIIRAVMDMEGITGIDIATRENANRISLPGRSLNVFEGYQNALKQSQAEVVYISTVNNEHAEWVEKALNYGFHVIVDKPAFLNLNTAENLLH